MAAERRRRRRVRMVAVVAVVAYALMVAEAIAAAWSLVTGDPWDWSRFGSFFFLVLVSAVASRAAEALARRGTFGSMSPQKQRKYDEDEETAQVVRTGLLPQDADPDRWRARIRRHVRQGVAIATFSTVLCLTAAVLTATAAHLNNHDEPVLWTLAVATLLALAPLFWLVARARSRAERLVARL